MNILYLTPTSAFSGGENVTLQIAQEMQKRGYTVAYCGVFGPIQEAAEARGVAFLGLKEFSLKEIRGVLREFRPEVVHAMDYRASFYAALLGTRMVGHLHSDCLWLKYKGRNSFALLYTGLRARKLICVAPNIPQNFVFSRWIRSKFATLANCIDADAIRQKAQRGPGTQAAHLGFCGRLSEAKNPLLFLRVVAGVKAQLPGVKAVMVGDGELRTQVEREIQALGLQQNVSLVGFQNNPFPYIAACKLMVMSSVWEGFPMVAMEAMVLGKPWVSTAVSGMVDLIDDSVGAIGNTAEELTAAVLKILQLPSNEYNLLTTRVRKRAQPYTNMATYIDEIEAFYQS